MMTKQKKFRIVKKRVGSLDLEVYRRSDRFGEGPCFSVIKGRIEVLRFDLFPKGAHYHSYREPGQPRHYFSYSGESYVPPRELEADARTGASPPWDVLMTSVLSVATKAHPRIAEVKDWVCSELAARYR